MVVVTMSINVEAADGRLFWIFIVSSTQLLSTSSRVMTSGYCQWWFREHESEKNGQRHRHDDRLGEVEDGNDEDDIEENARLIALTAVGRRALVVQRRLRLRHRRCRSPAHRHCSVEVVRVIVVVRAHAT